MSIKDYTSSTPRRKCALAECEEMLGAGYRSHARYCSAVCRAEASRRRLALDSSSKRTKAHTGLPLGRKQASRGPTRDGYGTKLYVSKQELEELRLGPPYPNSLQRKLHGATERIERRRDGVV